MPGRSVSTVRHILIFIATGCLLGALTVVATVFGTNARAFAACDANHVNVEGWDKQNPRYGNAADIYINTQATIESANDSIFRSLFVINDLNNWVEVGWTAKNGGHNNPTVYAAWKDGGGEGLPHFYTDFGLNYDTTKRFWVFNVGHQGVFRFKVDNQSTPFNYSPTMNFNLATLLTNSEHYNQCDSLWTEMTNIAYFDSSGSWNSGYGDLRCYTDTSTAWLFNKIDNTHLKVDLNDGVNC